MDNTIFGMDFESFNALAESYLTGALSKEQFASLSLDVQRELQAEYAAMSIETIDGEPLDFFLRRLTRLANFGFISEDECLKQGLEHIRHK